MIHSSIANIATCLQRTAKRYPAHTALARGTVIYGSYAQILERVQSLAMFLQGNFPHGARIGIFSPNCPQYLEALFGIWYAGMVAVPINCKLHRKEVAFILQDCAVSFTFEHERLTSAAFGAMCSRDSRLPFPEPVNAAAPAWIFYTSGTTGKPKGAILTHANLWAMCRAFQIDVVPIAPRDSMVHACQLSHGSGLYALPHVMQGGVNVVLEGGFDAREVHNLMQNWAGACTFGPPTVLNKVVAAALERQDPDGDRYKALIFGGSPLYVADAKRAAEITGGRIAQIYGQGESPCTITSVTPEMYAFDSLRAYITVGTAQHGVEIAIATHGTDETLVMGDSSLVEGEVLVRGPTVMAGYWGNPEASTAALKDGWLHTGDLGRIDADGYLTLIGRVKETIISGGFNVYPREVEEVLLTHPAVIECAVVGEPSAEWGEQVVAHIVVRPGVLVAVPTPSGIAESALSAALDALCLQSLARFKRPRRYLFVAELPRGLTDKVQKSALGPMPVGAAEAARNARELSDDIEDEQRGRARLAESGDAPA